MAETVTVDSAGAQMKIYEAKPAGAAKGAVIVIQEAFGITDHVMDIANRLAEAGYAAAAPHVFHRTGDPIIPYAQGMECVPHISALTREGITADIDATLARLADQGFSGKKVAIIGFCMGGTIAYFAATEWAMGAAIGFYGAAIEKGRFGLPSQSGTAAQLKTPYQGHYGDLDKSIPTNEVEALREAAKDAPVDVEIHRYAGAEHGFHCNDRSSFNEGASKEAWGRTIAFLDAHVGTN